MLADDETALTVAMQKMELKNPIKNVFLRPLVFKQNKLECLYPVRTFSQF
jgi:hypothetical protein